MAFFRSFSISKRRRGASIDPVTRTVTPASRRAAVTAQSSGGVILLRDGTAFSRRGGEEREDGGLGRGLHAVGGARERSGGVAVIGDVVLVGARGEQRADDVNVALPARYDQRRVANV